MSVRRPGAWYRAAHLVAANRGGAESAFPPHPDNWRGAMDLRSVWRNMHARCYLPRASGYKTTGGRGIIVERRWHDYEAFAKDVGVPPHRKYRFARKDLNGHFGPGNCAWMPPGTPQLRQRTRWFTDGVFKGTLGECAQRLQISKELARWRFKTWGTFEKGEQWRQLLK